MNITRVYEIFGTVVLEFLPVICIVGMFSVPIAILYGLENSSQKRLVEVTEIIQTTERVLDGYCDVTRDDGGVQRVIQPVNGTPYGEKVECTGEWLERPTTRTVTRHVLQ